MQMIASLSPDELAGIVKAVFEYNGHTPLSVRYVDAEGQPVVIKTIEVTCEGDGLAVRVRPEEACTPQDIARQFSSLDVLGSGNGAG